MFTHHGGGELVKPIELGVPKIKIDFADAIFEVALPTALFEVHPFGEGRVVGQPFGTVVGSNLLLLLA